MCCSDWSEELKFHCLIHAGTILGKLVGYSMSIRGARCHVEKQAPGPESRRNVN